MVAERTGPLDPAAFLAASWQREPALLRRAFPAFTSPVTGDDLAGLACRDDALARLVVGPDEDGAWEVTHAPLPEGRFAALPPEGWTLLVQDLDKWDPGCRALLDHFRFLPDWRLDDVMGSFAVPGGSVGAHVDHYDVFLVQAQGIRRWAIDASGRPPGPVREDSELRVLERFTPTHVWRLAPGDVLYLPPGIPHHGVAEDACITLSVGLRAPAVGELLLALAETLATTLGEAPRLTGAQHAPVSHPGRIAPETLASTRELLSDTLRTALAQDDRAFATWFGRFITRYRLPERPDAACSARAPDAAASFARDPWTRWAFVEADGEALLFVDGEALACSPALARTLTGARHFDARTLPTAGTDGAVIEALVARGALRAG